MSLHAFGREPCLACQLASRDAVRGHVLHAMHPHGHRHQPGGMAGAGCRAVPGGPVRYPMLELIVYLDGERHERA